MNLHRGAATFVLMALSGLASGQVVTRLTCEGNITTAKDGEAGKREAAVIDVSINLASKQAILEGSWGCSLSFFQNKNCGGVLEVSVTDDSITFSDRATNETVRVETSFSLHRFSGVFRGSNVLVNFGAPKAG